MIWSKGRQANLLRSTLREFYPAALVAFDDLASGDALEVLSVAPTPTLGAGPVAFEDRSGATPRRPPTPGRGASGRDPSRAALRAVAGTCRGGQRHGGFGRGPVAVIAEHGRPDRPAGRGARLGF